MQRILIVGGVAAGASAATRARRLDEHAEITIFERGGFVSFANCGLPYYIGGIIESRESLLLQTPEKLKRRFNIDVRLRHEVISIDREGKRILVKNLQDEGEGWYKYDRLILAPGAAPIHPTFGGVDSDNVFHLRTIEDSDALRLFLDESRVCRATIVGAGFIGLEAAEMLVHRGISVDVVELTPQVLPPLDPDMAAMVAEHLSEKGVSLHLGQAVENLAARNGRVFSVELPDGRTIKTDVVLLSIGIRPITDLARNAGLAVGPRGGIRVNERLETSDPAILAAGDAVEVIHAVTGQPVLIPLAGPANKHGRIAGAVAATGSGPAYPTVAGTAIIGLFGLSVATCGLSYKAAKAAGIEAESVMVTRRHHAGYYPGGEHMTIKLVYQPGTRRVLGGQIVGGPGVDRRIDVISTVIHFEGTTDDLASLDLAYAPQFGAAKDPAHIAAFVAGNQENGLIRHVRAEEVDQLIRSGYSVVDVRHPDEFFSGAIAGAVNISLEELRAEQHRLSPDRPILLYCEVGQRGYYAARILHGLGRDDVVNLAGGLVAYEIHKRTTAGASPPEHH